MSTDKPNQAETAVSEDDTIQLYEKHKTVYVRAVKGWWASWRWVFVALTQLIFYSTIWLQWNGRQAVLFDILERKFYLFGLVLWPQDVIYLTLLLLISAYSLFLFTAVAGRLFCGYACPQTVYTEIFLWIEEQVEGSRASRIKLDNGPFNASKLLKKSLKHIIFLLIALWSGWTLVGWFYPVRDLLADTLSLNLGGWSLFWILFYSSFFYMQAGFLREQVCKYMCPYARFQGVMYDPDTLVITYDPKRGEPRGSRKKGQDHKVAGLGDCVDCSICVQVCPTGIDIRNGLQYECIGCGACIDACDDVMEKVHSPKGLVRYTSENALAQHYDMQALLRHIFRPRIMLYTTVLWAIIIATAVSLYLRNPLKLDIIRDRSVLFREAQDGRIENLYKLRIMNTSEHRRRVQISAEGLPDLEVSGDGVVDMPPAANKAIGIALRGDAEAGKQGANRVHLQVRDVDNNDVVVREATTFILPR